MYNCEFVITKIDTKTKAPTHHGVFSILKNETGISEVIDTWSALSGGWGKGPLEEGKYKCYEVRSLPADKAHAAFMVDGKAWVMGLLPLFKTDRFDLAVHPDGNLPGTLGCVGILERCKECFEQLDNYKPTGLSVKVRLE